MLDLSSQEPGKPSWASLITASLVWKEFRRWQCGWAIGCDLSVTETCQSWRFRDTQAEQLPGPVPGVS